MEESEIVKLEDSEIKQEVLSSDDEYEFQFEIDDTEYDAVIKELRAKDSDLEEFDEVKHECSHPNCTRSFARKHNLSRHMKTHEMPIDRLGSICHICGKNIKGVYSLHLKVHQKAKQYRCEECGREFRQKVALQNHLLIHQNEKPYECQWCFKRFRQKYTLKHHMTRHTGVKEFICDLCGKEFGEKATLQKHSLVHSTNKPHQCGTCFMSFRHKSSLSRHNKIHLKTTQCHLCRRTFRYESFMKKHLLTAHKDEEVFVPPYAAKKEEVVDECVIISYETEDQKFVNAPESSHYYSQPAVIVNNVNHHQYAS